ncbi:sushi, von Willebrand factor type A, EGF and pentraxin domain-containing protein 1-like isoform X2 [Lineus longissimus]|uniref:sushi, von Willebrand factor type A, EGF and pentraxin domain-containing protein 1-like isoform X2 n=1 Tax=Lineus longissimus TaxID=88925 RepID=UPI002B4C25A8
MDTSYRDGAFLSVCVCVTIIVQAVTGDNIDCQDVQDVQCLHPNVTNGEAKQLPVSMDIQSTVATPFGDYGDYGQADDTVGGSESVYGNYDYDTNGNVIPKYPQHTRMTVRCNRGYIFRANFTGVITCQKSSAADCGIGWSEDTSTLCSPALCNPKALKNAKLTGGICDDMDDNTTLTDLVPMNQTACLRCEDGFRLSDVTGTEVPSLVIRCNETGQWDATGKCTNAIACPKLTKPRYGFIHSFSRLSRVVFGCDDRFIMVGSPSLECERGNWSALPPLCRFKASCLTNTLPNGNISVDPSKMGSGPWVRNSTSATFTCETGFTHLTDRTSIFCVRGEWMPKPRCVLDKPFACPVFGVVAHGTVSLTTSRILPGTEAKVSCDSGFTLQGSANRTCQENGSWSGESSSCIQMTQCSAPPIVNNAFAPTAEAYMEGEVIRYRCSPGYMLIGQSRITCSKSGLWSDVDFHCRTVSCGTPSSIRNTIREGNSFRFGDYVNYKCRPGFKMTSGILTSRVCQPNRRWTVIGMRCEEALCPALPHIPHGTLEHISGWSWKYRSIYRYVCDRGYKFSGADSVELTCGGNQGWDRSVPSCEIVKCPLLTPPAHGVLKPNGNADDGMEFGTGYAVGCDPGYKLKGKEPGEELLWLCQRDGTWSDEQAECQDRKIFRTRQEWATFLDDRKKDCCPLWREHYYKWDYRRCDLNRDIKWECITDTWRKDEVCYRSEITEDYGWMTSHEKDQTWYALLGVKVPKYGDQCCWNHPEKEPYECYEYPAEFL